MSTKTPVRAQVVGKLQAAASKLIRHQYIEKRLRKDRDKQIRNAVAAGLSPAEIAKAVGISKMRVSVILRNGATQI